MHTEHTRRIETLPVNLEPTAVASLARKSLATLADTNQGVVFEATLRSADSVQSTKDVEELQQLLASTADAESVEVSVCGLKSPDDTLGFVTLEFLPHRASIRTSSADEAWCAGAADIAARFAHAHRSWYWPARSKPVMLALLLAVGGVPLLLAASAWAEAKPAFALVIGVGGYVVAAAGGYYYTSLFPSFRIRGRSTNFLRSHSAEIATLCAIIGTLVALASLLWRP